MPDRTTYSSDGMTDRDLNACSSSDVTRMAGISLRRTGEFNSAMNILEEALHLSGMLESAQLPSKKCPFCNNKLLEEEPTALERNLEKARNVLQDEPTPRLQANIDFGLLSMTIITLQSRPWLLLKVPSLFQRHERGINSPGPNER